METRRKLFTGKVIDAPAGKPIVAVVSTSDPDLIGDVIHQGPNDRGKGWLLDDFNARGRVYWMHDPFRPNLAKASAKVDGTRLLLSVQFDQGDDFARELDRKYREGYLTEWSVGFRPVEYDENNEHGGWTIYEAALDEVSAVNQGMHPGTGVISKAYNDYADMAAEVTTALDSYDKRLREIEAAVMRMENKHDEIRAAAQLRAMVEQLRRGRARA